MKEYPHIYHSSAIAGPDGTTQVNSPGLETIQSNAPPEFGGPEGYWSPETLLVASVVSCFILTFRAIARASKFEFLELDCKAEGTLDKRDRKTVFTGFLLKASLQIPADAAEDKAERLLQMAEKNCLITNSIDAEVHLNTTVYKST